MSNDTLIEVKGLKKYFKVGKNQLLKAVDDVSFSIKRGETLGMVGESGCGKTTVGRTILGLYDVDGGSVLFDGVEVHAQKGKEYKALTKQMQMIFQDPYASLNPRKTVSAIVGEGLDIHKMYKTKAERMEKIYNLLELVGLNREHANRFPHEFSGGQRQRIGIARALAVEPKFIVCDEAISALDVSIQAQIINLLMKLQSQYEFTYLFIAHDLTMVQHISDSTAVMYLGTLVETGRTEDIFSKPLHPYTKGLLAAAPEADPDYEMSKPSPILTGEVPSPINPKPGCRFFGRCNVAIEICSKERPALVPVDEHHLVACHVVNTLKSEV
ncbi:ABC transporter ATP-binding protein [Fusibacter ferrireducens]|uniref:ABC transporter ATP-binding protein n=1 Tax=Fusibacter ferrireducens TaxID=2785058 RepID=A0ABR9ZSJ7_9FIRM|nr:ABC transporter ATP-binding protein [Fusibacter ferrireducens]MBF4693444.1 ABC transporter ATP-binding protein [Fusibacter ferrireducens]